MKFHEASSRLQTVVVVWLCLHKGLELPGGLIDLADPNFCNGLPVQSGWS